MDYIKKNWQSAVAAVSVVVVGMVAYKAIDKFFGIERRLPRGDMKKAA